MAGIVPTEPAPHEASAGRGLLSLLWTVAVVISLMGLVVTAVVASPGVVAVFGDADGDHEGVGDPVTVHPDDPGESTYDADGVVSSVLVEEAVHEEINERRADEGEEPLETDVTVASVARAHSADMNDRDYFDHQTPGGDGPLDRFSTVADYCHVYGENIARTWLDRNVRDPTSGTVDTYETVDELAEGLVEQWMNSPPHRDGLLDPNWERTGVGIYLSDDGEVFATQNFCEEA